MNTIVFTIDERECKLRLAHTNDETLNYKTYRFSRDYLGEAIPDYDKIFAHTLNEYFKQNKVRGAKLVYVMPDKYFFYDFVETPTIFAKRQQDILALELATRFPMQGVFKTVFVPFTKEKGKVASVAFMVRNSHLAAANNALKRFRFVSRAITFESAMLANAYMTYEPASKRRPVMFAAIQGDKTKVIVLREGQLLFFANVPYGKNVCAVKEELCGAPSVLTRTKPEIKAGPAQTDGETEESDGEEKPAADNNKYILRTLAEMQHILAEKYGLDDLVLKYCINGECAADFEKSAAEAGMDLRRVTSDNLETQCELDIFGAFSTKIYNKGLVF